MDSKNANKNDVTLFGVRNEIEFHTGSKIGGGTKSGRSSSQTTEINKYVTLRVTLEGDQVYEDAIFLSREEWISRGIPDVFGDYQLVFYSKRERQNTLILAHQMNVTQIECKQR